MDCLFSMFSHHFPLPPKAYTKFQSIAHLRQRLRNAILHLSWVRFTGSGSSRLETVARPTRFPLEA